MKKLSTVLDGKALPVRCPKCKHTFKVKAGLLKTNPKIPCPACSRNIQIIADDLVALEKQLDEKMEAIRKAVERFNSIKIGLP